MTEKKNEGDMLSALLGNQGQDALKMLQRMERLKRLMGSPAQMPAEKNTETRIEKKEDLFVRNRSENMISAAIPFLDWEYQKDLYIVVRLMEMRRMLSGGLLEARGKQEQPPAYRRRQMLGAMRPYLLQEERNQLDTIVKMMDLKEIMEREEEK